MIYEYGIADPNVASREATVPYQDFLDGNVAMSLLNPWGMGLVTEESADHTKTNAVVPLPQVGSRRIRSAPLYAYYWSISAASEVKEAASLPGRLPRLRTRPVASERQLHPAEGGLERATRGGQLPVL